MAMMRGSVRNVIIALVIPEIPRGIRLVRGSVLSLREHTMVEGARELAFWIILFPGLFLALTVLAINLVGDSLRDLPDVRG